MACFSAGSYCASRSFTKIYISPRQLASNSTVRGRYKKSRRQQRKVKGNYWSVAVFAVNKEGQFLANRKQFHKDVNQRSSLSSPLSTSEGVKLEDQKDRIECRRLQREMKRDSILSGGNGKKFLPRMICALGDVDRAWLRQGSFEDGNVASGEFDTFYDYSKESSIYRIRNSPWLEHDGLIDIRNVHAERTLSLLDCAWEKETTIINSGRNYEDEIEIWNEMCKRRRCETQLKLEEDNNGENQLFNDMLTLRIKELEEYEQNDLERRRSGRPELMTSVIAESTDTLQLKASVTEIFKRIRREKCKILQLHYAEYVQDRKLLSRKIKDAALTIADFVFARGYADHFGVINLNAEMLQMLLDEGIPISTAQFQLSVVDRRALSSVLPLCYEHDITPLAHGPLAGGLFTDQSRLLVDERRTEKQKRVVYSRKLDTNSASRQRGWSYIAKAGGFVPFQQTIKVMAEVAKEEINGTSISSITLAYIMSMAEEVQINMKSSSRVDKKNSADDVNDFDNVDESSGICLILGHGKTNESYFAKNKRAVEKLFLSNGAIANIDAAVSSFQQLDGDVFDWERELTQ